jgi:hypothetical protein
MRHRRVNSDRFRTGWAEISKSPEEISGSAWESNPVANASLPNVLENQGTCSPPVAIRDQARKDAARTPIGYSKPESDDGDRSPLVDALRRAVGAARREGRDDFVAALTAAHAGASSPAVDEQRITISTSPRDAAARCNVVSVASGVADRGKGTPP